MCSSTCDVHRKKLVIVSADHELSVEFRPRGLMGRKASE